jgi:RNA ligase (TIGR02306 family)
MKLITATETIDLSPGTEVSHLIGVTKYEAPAPQALDAKGPLPFGLAKTDEERFQNIEDLPFGEDVMVTLKVDGQSATYFCHKNRQTGDWTTGICSRSLEMKPECLNNYTRIDRKYTILNNLMDYCKHHDVSLALRGEIFGGGIQAHHANPHSKLPLDFAAFNVYNFDTFSYENYENSHYYEDVCSAIGVPTVPNIGGQMLTQDLIKWYSEDISEIDGKPFEGVVVKHRLGSFKIINLNYDSGK